MKRILSFILAVLMIVTTLAAGITVQAKLPFNDVDGHWGESSIEYVVENGLMNGVGNGESFAPDMSLTRGMVVTVLYRDNGSPKQDFKGTFLDVTINQYYSDAAEWAFANGIVNGTGFDDWGEPYFSPDRDITRQELATMFARYAAFKHVDTTKGSADISTFPDASSVADWASDAVKWAVGVGLITGKGGSGAATLSPTDKAVRAEFATIIKRFNEKKLTFDYHLAYATPELKSSYTEQPYSIVNNADVYVAVDGSDSNPGTLDKPLATFEAAKAKVRELKKTAGDEIVVAFKAGNYGKLDNLTFTSEDSGTEKVPVTYCKYGDGDVIFTNGIILYADDFENITDEERKLFPAESGNLIKKMSLKGMLPGELQISNYLFSEVDGIIWLARDLNKNGLGQDSYYTDKVTDGSDRSKSITLLQPLPDKVKSFSTIEGLMFKGMLLNGYTYHRFDVESFNYETGELFVDLSKDADLFPDMPEGSLINGATFAEEGRFQDKIFFYNLPEFMDDQGEYWVDRKNEILYIYNPRGRYTFCTDGTMMTVETGADHLSFIGLEFNGCADTMIYSNGDHVTYDRCTFANVGGHYGLRAEGVNNFSFINSDIHNFVDGGLYIISDADFTTLTSANNVVRNNAFYDFGLSEYWSNALRIENDIACLIEHNEFRRGVHGALRYDHCIDTMIQYNVFDTLMMTTEDYGAMYCINNTIYRDNVTRYNLFMNITGEAKQFGKGCYGFYVDDSSCGQIVYGNIFYNGGIHAVTLHDGRDNIVENNIVVSVDTGLNMGNGGDLIMYTQGMSSYVDEDGNIINEYTNDKFYRYLQELPKEGDAAYAAWHDRWPLMYSYHYDATRINEVECGFNVVNYIKNNAIIGAEIIDHEDNRDVTFNKYGVSENNIEYEITENPFFVNPAIGDYRIREDADFLKIPYEKIGRY